MISRSKFIILPVVAVLFFAAARCGAQLAPAVQQEAEKYEYKAELPELAAVALNGGEKLKVVATTSIVADVVKNVGGDAIDLTLLLPVGVDPHAFEPAPRDLAVVADAHIVFANGLGLEEFLGEMIENVGGQTAVISVSDGIEPREFSDKLKKAEADHYRQGGDPHTWTTPVNALIFVRNIQYSLSALNPANAAVYEANAAVYKVKLAELDAWVSEQIESIPPENRALVTDHTVFGYFADQYGLKQVGAIIPSFSSAAEPSAKDLAELEQAIETYNAKAIFVGVSVNPALAEQIAKDTGVELVKLYTGSLGPSGSGVETYLDYIRYNTNAIVKVLK